MEKTDLILLFVFALLIVGAIFVSAHFEADEVKESENTITQPYHKMCNNAKTCNPETCSFNCGGNCPVPTCGCGR